MKRFKFRLESVLTLRNWEEERARTAYAQAFKHEQKLNDALRLAEQLMEEALTNWRIRSQTTGPASEIAMRWRHMLQLDKERAEVAQKVVAARHIREQKMKLLVDAHRRVRVLETLKTKRLQAHVTESRIIEEKEIDDLVSARFQPDL